MISDHRRGWRLEALAYFDRSGQRALLLGCADDALNVSGSLLACFSYYVIWSFAVEYVPRRRMREMVPWIWSLSWCYSAQG